MLVAAFLAHGPAAATAPIEVSPIPHGCDVGALRGAARPPRPPASLVSTVRPFRVWYDPSHPNSAAIAPAVVTAIEEAWDVQVDVLGFRPPVLPDAALGPELDIYVIEYVAGAAFVAADGYLDDLPGDGHNGTSAFMVIDGRLPLQAVPSYTAHEFNHVLQFATDFSEPTLPIWEATATAAQEWTQGADGYWDFDVPSFQEVPEYSAITADSYTVFPDSGLGWNYEYGAALWVMFLDAKYRATTASAGVDLWEAASNEGFDLEPDVVDAIEVVAGQPIGVVMGELALTRFLTGEDWDARGLPDAESWGLDKAVPAEPVTGDHLPFDRAPVAPPQILGQAFFDIDLAGAGAGPDDALTVSATSASGLDSTVTVAWWADDGSVGDAVAWGPDPALNLAAGGLVRAMVAVTNLGPVDWDGDENPYVPGDQIVHVSITPSPPPVDTDEPADTGDLRPPDSVDDGSAGGGCGCHSTPATSPWWFAWLAAGLAVRRRR